MDFSTVFDICSILISAVIISANVNKKYYDKIKHYMYVGLIFSVILSSSVRIVSRVVVNNNGSFSSSVLYFLSYFSLYIESLVPVIYSLYCVSVYDSSLLAKKTRQRALFIVLMAAETLWFAAAYSGGMIFYFDENMRRTPRLFGCAAVFALSLYYIVFGIFYALSFRKTDERRNTCSLVIMGIMLTGSMLCEGFLPVYVSPNIFCAFGLLSIQVLSDRSEDYIESVTSLPNKKAFIKHFKLNLKSGDHKKLYLFYVENLRLLNLTAGVNAISEILKKIAGYFEIKAEDNIFCLEQGVFAVFADIPPAKKDEYFDGVFKRFSMPWKTSDSEFLVSVKAIEIRIPEDADSYERVYVFSDYLRSSETSSGQLEYASNAVLKDNARILLVENCIKKAIENNGFEMYYQPIYSVAEKKIVSAEALIRLKDPEHGFISPAEFIPIAEQNGSIIRIGKSVLNMVFDFVSKHTIEDYGLEYIEVNLSVIQCMQKNLADSIMNMALKNAVKSKHINLEITETAAAERPLMLIQNMKMLVENNYTFSLDDFGTGYSNISSMVDMPLHIIKFDKSILDRAKESEDGKILISSLAAMVKKMGKRIVAEGIETEEQFREMEEIGIDYIQGYYFSKPLPEDEFVEFVKNFNKVRVASTA